MFDDEYTDSPSPILACGHVWDGEEPWEAMAVILKDWVNEPEGSRPVVSAGHYCRACRLTVPGERMASMELAWAWLRQAQAQ